MGNVGCVGEKRGTYRILVERPERSRPLGHPGLDGRIILKLNSRIVIGDMDWIVLAQDRDRWRGFVNVIMNLLIPQNTGDFLAI
jgi:hypothetical protein